MSFKRAIFDIVFTKAFCFFHDTYVHAVSQSATDSVMIKLFSFYEALLTSTHPLFTDAQREKQQKLGNRCQ